jgi:regulatory protein
MRRRLAMRGVDEETIAEELERLQRAGLLDDEAFARAWVDERERLSPRGSRMLRLELRRHGIAAEQVEAATAGVDDHETALELARRKAHGVAASDFRTFVTRVGGFLQRRGFDHETVMEATRTAWNELGRGADD